MTHSKSSLFSLIIIILLTACSDSAENVRNLPPSEQDLFVRNNMAGTWQYDTCWRDGDSDHFYQTSFYIFRPNLSRTEQNNHHGTFEIHNLLYSPNDTNCVGDPISRIVETGTFHIGEETTAGIFELNLVYSASDIFGDVFLGEPALDPYTNFPKYNYELVSYDGTSGNVLITTSFASSTLDRPTALTADLLSIDSLPANMDQFQAVPTYSAVDHNTLAGTWYSTCETEGAARRLLTYNFTPPASGGTGTVTYTESIHPDFDNSCNDPELASIVYTGTYTIHANPVDITYPATIAAAGVDMNLTAKSGDTVTPHASLSNWDVPYIKQETMAVELTRGILLNSRGEGDGTPANPRPENLEIIYINTAR